MLHMCRYKHRNLKRSVVSIFGKTHGVLEGRAQHFMHTLQGKVRAQCAQSVHQAYSVHILCTLINDSCTLDVHLSGSMHQGILCTLKGVLKDVAQHIVSTLQDKVRAQCAQSVHQAYAVHILCTLINH